MIPRTALWQLLTALVFVASLGTVLAAEDEQPSVARAKELVSSRFLEDRRRGIEMFGKLGERAVPQLLELLSDGGYNASACAAIALGRRGHPRALDRLHDLVGSDTDMYTPLALELLPRYGPQGYTPAMVELCAATGRTHRFGRFGLVARTLCKPVRASAGFGRHLSKAVLYRIRPERHRGPRFGRPRFEGTADAYKGPWRTLSCWLFRTGSTRRDG
ncbi:MAG: HEAT repeat domain-containing protein [Planctomycetota bacterium]|nr:HEAT repeat domain-containing protein [Planctomycetota bacterium]